ncbi:hypothetical protein HK100_000244 [Physocladia obscura]|uniref:Uncharacterized protein n=1 Tax=Physocladia obscura TaxID=109957 RepID=A0AAD5T042_9FUNG|nr:hypothetical protein HK100_000244 [Physocladia obscura]
MPQRSNSNTSPTSRTVHIPGSHALPPGISTIMAWELAYRRKRILSDTARHIKDATTVNPHLYKFRKEFSLAEIVEDGLLERYNEALMVEQQVREADERGQRRRLGHVITSVGGGEEEGSVKNLDHLNPYYMHMEVIRRRYSADEFVRWNNNGRRYHQNVGKQQIPQFKIHNDGIPVGGWPSGIDFEMGVQYMPEIANAPIDNTRRCYDGNDNIVRVNGGGSDGEIKTENWFKREVLGQQQEQKQQCSPQEIHRAQKGEEGEEFLQEKEKENDGQQVQEGDDENRVKNQAENNNDQDGSDENNNQSDDRGSNENCLENYLQKEPQQFIANQQINQQSQQNYGNEIPLLSQQQKHYNNTQKYQIHPLPLIQSTVCTNPTQLPRCYAANRRYHQTPVHPDLLQKQNGCNNVIHVHTQYLDAYNAAAAVNGQPLAVAIPGSSSTTRRNIASAVTGRGARMAQMQAYRDKFAARQQQYGAENARVLPVYLAPLDATTTTIRNSGEDGYRLMGQEEAEHRHWRELLQLEKPVGRRGWNHVGRDHLGNCIQGLGPVMRFAGPTDDFFPAEKKNFR